MKVLPPYKKAAPREDCLDADAAGIARVHSGSRKRDHAVRVDIREDPDPDAPDVGRRLMFSPHGDPEVRGRPVRTDLEVRAEAFPLPRPAIGVEGRESLDLGDRSPHVSGGGNRLGRRLWRAEQVYP